MMMEAGIPKHASSPREPKIPHSLLIQIHCVNRRKNTKQVKVSFRYTLKGIYGKFEVGTEREWIQPFAWKTKNWNILKEQDAIFNTACPQRWWHSALVNHYTIDGHGNWCIPFDTAIPQAGICYPELLAEVYRGKNRWRDHMPFILPRFK